MHRCGATAVTEPQRIAPGSLTVDQVLQLSPGVLAYIGDAVYELYVRSTLLFPVKPIDRYHRQVVTQVCAAGQVEQLSRWLNYLDESEKEIVRRGRNAAVGASRKANPQQYRKATGLEALVGYLYLTNPDRLQQLWQYLDFSGESSGTH
ncbi:MAG: Mini-ribonuclease 3 [Prochlorotrichaceae cyanobacterium]